MSLITLIMVLIVIGLLLFAVNNWLPMDGKIKMIINVVVIIAVIFWLITAFFPGMQSIRVGG